MQSVLAMNKELEELRKLRSLVQGYLNCKKFPGAYRTTELSELEASADRALMLYVNAPRDNR